MKSFPKPFLSFLLTAGLIISFNCDGAQADCVRRPVRAGSFYPADAPELTRMIDRLTQKAQKTRVRIPRDKALRALIMPHAGYIYSGWTAAHASQVLKRNQFSKVVLIGPDHKIGIRNGAICDAAAYQTPLGRIELHGDTAGLRRQPALFQSLPLSMDSEHSLEVILPFLQTYLGKFDLVPIIVGRADVEPLAEALNTLIDDNTLLVVSSDLSHFLDYSDAVSMDRETVAGIIDLDPAMLVSKANRACGLTPLLILTEIARRNHWQPVLLHYSNSGDTAGSRSRVVGYTTIAFFGDQLMDKQHDSKAGFSEEQGQALVKLARHTIMEKLGRNIPDSEPGMNAPLLKDEKFKSHCGTFVTLKIRGQLRGCIGNLSSTETVWDGVKRNAINAAFHDPRFSPITAKEFDQIKIEVSVLTEPRPLEYLNGKDLTQKLRVNVDGLIIRKGHASATFLPQVWEQLPRPEEFLSHLCMKAGLPSDAWKDPELEVLTYQVQYFEED
ncbi:MAG: AmmeMemoRadiSam system protein B [Desulfobacteraceae bacterium]|nr:AmmeMemoRadiSam system protein B [Desulfobacteraceae bacterium]